ncbi:MAG: hypothetical protein ACR2NO_11600 [Chloroflexota bacterium]
MDAVRSSPALTAASAVARWARAEAVSHSTPIRSRYERAFHRPDTAGEFERLLRPLARRLIWQRTVHHAPRAALVGALFALALTLVTRGLGLPGLPYLTLPFALLIALATVFVVARRDARPFEVARRTDAALGLRERIATALELSDTAAEGPLVQRQVADAQAVLSHVDPRGAFPTFAPGSAARARATRSAGWGALALTASLVLLLWPTVGSSLLVDREGALALADSGRREDDAIPRFRPEDMAGAAQPGDGLRGLTDRPEALGDLQGLLGQQPSQNQGQALGETARDARREAADQQSGDVAQREQALAALGEALRQSQTAKQAGESLRSGDTARASQQLAQVAEQVRDLSPGERQALAQAFQQAASNIGDRDRQLARAAQRAADALRDFRNQDAQRAIGDASAQVRESGQQLRQQRELESRQEQLQTGRQPNLPSLQPSQPQAGAGQSDPGQRTQQAPSRTEAGGAGAGAFDLSALEAELRDGSLQTGAGGSGAGGGTSAGSEKPGAPTRLSVDGRTLTVDAEVRDGPSQWRPLNPSAPPAVMPPPAVHVPGAPASASQVASGLDVNAVPIDLAGSVKQYFTPAQPSRP